jgi:sugar phosphate isomerase/epimerase
MKLAVSNIAWQDAEQPAVFELLRYSGVSGIEVAPTRLWPDWQGADAVTAEVVRDKFAQIGFEIPALQAILFGKPELKLFSDDESQQQLIDHLSLTIVLARSLGARVLVFGSPRNRQRGELSMQEAMSQAEGFFRKIGHLAEQAGVKVCIEPNPQDYHCNFITRWNEAAELVRCVDHPGFGLHLDSGCIHMAGDDAAEAIKTTIDLINHFHISEPKLSGFSSPQIDHLRIGQALAKAGYAGWVSIEMRRPEIPLQGLADAIKLVKEAYPV